MNVFMYVKNNVGKIQWTDIKKYTQTKTKYICIKIKIQLNLKTKLKK